MTARSTPSPRAPRPLPIDLPERPRILVVVLRRIGDVLLTTPLIRSLRRAWPDAAIEVLAFTDTVGIVEGNPDIDRVISMPGRPSAAETAKLAARLCKRYDLAISTQTGDRPTLFALLAGRTHVGLSASDSRGAAFKRRALHRSTPAVGNIHRVEQMLRLADVIGIARVPELVGPAASEAIAIPAGGNYALIHAAPMFRYKQWTREGWRALAAGLAQRGLAVVATSSPDVAEQEYLRDVWQGIATVQPAKWRETMTLLSRARVYVGPDTSVTHLAAASGCPTVALFGPMDPRVWGPWPIGGLTEPWAMSGTIQRRGNVWIVQNPLPCMPCLLEGCERHIASRSACLDELSPQSVLAAVDQALDARSRSETARASM
jgi:heptosyltransferase-3